MTSSTPTLSHPLPTPATTTQLKISFTHSPMSAIGLICRRSKNNRFNRFKVKFRNANIMPTKTTIKAKKNCSSNQFLQIIRTTIHHFKYILRSKSYCWIVLALQAHQPPHPADPHTTRLLKE